MFTYLSDNKLFNETQHGFRGGRSCLSALLDVFDNIMNMLGKDPSVDMVYSDFAKAFDKVDHGILLHKLKDLGITGKLGVWFFHFLSNRSHFVRLPGGVSNDHPVISGVPQGTVLGPLLFLITISDINKDISSSKLISFADDTRIYSKIADVSDCDNLQYDLNMIYDWAITNNMFFNAQKFHYVSFNTDPTGNKCNVYVNTKMDIIPHSSNVQDLGITMSSDCTFNVHINSLSKRCKNLTGWILRTFIWFFHFLSNRSHFVRLPGGVSNDHPVISGVPQGTVLGPLLFLITISDINKDISSSKLISFADDTRIYSKIADVSDCDNLQYDLNMIYDWAITNNMFFNAQKFHYVSFNTDPTGNKCNVYVNTKMDIIPHSSNVQDLGITMSSDCTFNVHINSLSKRCKNLTGWILRTFIWFFHFLSNRSHFVRLPGGVSNDHPVISGVPQGTVLGPLLFLITISDINKDISSSKLISFADDTRIYSKIADVSDCDNLQYDLNMIYDWAITNNMFFNAQKFHYVSFNTDPTGNKCNVYVNTKMDIIPHSSNVQDLGITMSSDCTFNVHINSLSKRCKNLTGWILRTFISRDKLTMLTLFKALVLSRLDYGSQLWSPHKICQINQIEKIQRAFTKHITGMYDLPYTKRLKMLNLNSLHRRRERYCIIYLWKILEGLVPNLSDPIVCSFSDRRGRSCIVSHVNPGRQGTLAFNSFRWRSVRIFNRLPIHIRNISACSIDRFKSQLDRYLRTIPDLPSQPGYNNSLDGGDGIQRWTLRAGLAAE